MKTMFKTIFQVLLMLTVSSGLVFGQPASKAAAAVSGVVRCATSTGAPIISSPCPTIATNNTAVVTGAFFNVISTTIKPPAGQSDLLVTFSTITTLTTNSVNSDQSTTLNTPTTTRESTAIQVRLRVDGNPVFFAAPFQIVTLDNLIRETTLNLVTASETEILSLLLTEGGVRSLTWAVPSVGPGDHTVTVQARFVFQNSFTVTAASSNLLEAIGPSTLTVEGVNIKNF